MTDNEMADSIPADPEEDGYAYVSLGFGIGVVMLILVAGLWL